MSFEYKDLLNYSYIMKHKGQLRESLLENNNLRELRIAVLCGATFGVVQDFLEIFLLINGIKPVFWIGGYNRIYEDACFKNDSLCDFKPEIILVHMSNRNLLSGFGGTDEESLENEKLRLEQIWDGIRVHYKCTIIQNNFEFFPYRVIGNAARIYKNGNVRFINQLNSFIDSHAEAQSDLYVNDVQYMAAYYGGQIWSDHRMWDLYKYPMSMDVTPAYANNIANLIKSILGENKKLVITDLDNTLWGGIIGDDGLDGIKIGSETAQGEGYTRLQNYIKAFSKCGTLLGICSKNEEDIAMQGLQSKKSVLHESDFISKRINWNPKSENISEMLVELNLLEDSAIFIDDNPMELLEVASGHPKITVISSESPDNLINEFEVRSFFEMTSRTEEDKNREKYYRNEKKRAESAARYKDYGEYLSSLEMRCVVDNVNKSNIERVTQLFNKTNQFNFLTVRYTKEELEELCSKDEVRSFVLELDDKFGSNGIVSVAVVKMSDEYADIIGWIMSCRVFNRDLEYVMLGLICRQAMVEGKNILRGYYRETDKNKKICDFYPSVGFHKVGTFNENKVKKFECSDLERIKDYCGKNYIQIIMKEDLKNG
jgi:FkbH-like protein